MQTITDVNVKNSVLIVDDEKANLIALTQILNKEYTVYAAKSGQEAVETAKERLPDIILLDIIMPEMDGYEVIWNLKNIEETRTIPVIFITGLSNAADEEKGLGMGASDYISKPFSPAIVKLRVQNQIMLSNQYNLVKTLSLTDQLTGLFNRRGFDSRLQLEWNRAKRDKKSLGLFLIDIDNFKNYNDTYGHLQGDEALKATAKILKKTLKRSIDFAARWGGEEFAAMLPETGLQSTRSIAEKFREDLENAEIKFNAGSMAKPELTKITVSIGVNVYLPAHEPQSGLKGEGSSSSDSDISIQDFVNGADNALYVAKKSGKNKVCVFEKQGSNLFP